MKTGFTALIMALLLLGFLCLSAAFWMIVVDPLLRYWGLAGWGAYMQVTLFMGLGFLGIAGALGIAGRAMFGNFLTMKEYELEPPIGREH